MSRVSFLLMIAVMVSALYLVRTQYESRSLTTEIYTLHIVGSVRCV